MYEFLVIVAEVMSMMHHSFRNRVHQLVHGSLLKMSQMRDSAD
jgi:hypothetical protein